MGFKYRETVLTSLVRHGVIPDRETPPELVHEFINDLYRYEIRKLRERFRAGFIAKPDFANRVDELRRRYPILSLPVGYWTEPD